MKVNVIKDVDPIATDLAVLLVHANGYELEGIVRADENPSGDYLYYVIARNERDAYTSWLMNTETKTLNHGRYDFESHLACLADVLTDRVSRYEN